MPTLSALPSRNERMRTVRFLIASCLCCVLFLSSCTKTAQWATPYNGVDLAYIPSVYYANYGKICFLYDATQDEIAVIEDEDTVCISNHDGGAYSLAIHYEADTLQAADAKAAALELIQGSNLADCSQPEAIEKADCFDCFRIHAVCDDGSACAVVYGNTETGHFQISYIIAPAATNDQADHVLEVLQTVTFGQYSEQDIVFVGT